MNDMMARIKRAVWTYKQPLTHVPETSGAPISDLFLWRKNTGWKTYFELTDMASLYDARDGVQADDNKKVSIWLFDSTGKLASTHEVEAPRFRRKQVDISALAERCDDEAGTFCVMHSHTPVPINQLGSHLAERGYVCYRYLDAPLLSYVHGNLDAVSAGPDGKPELLAGYGPLTRQYRLQHELQPAVHYELALVNPTRREQGIVCDVLQTSDEKLIESRQLTLAAGGSCIVPLAPQTMARRVIIKSHLVMARPLIFRIKDQRMDVLHG